MSSSGLWDAETAQWYDEDSAHMFAPEVLDPTVDFLAALAPDGSALEFAVGTGRVAIPLRRRGLDVAGIELSAPMAEQLHRKEPELPVAVGDMATLDLGRTFDLVYLVFNTIGNVRTQSEQVACFTNAARHLVPGGRFVIEVGVPPIRRFPPGQHAVPFEVTDEYTGFDTFDMATQDAVSHHYTRRADGTYRYDIHRYRYVWPGELDLMARIAGMSLERRVEDWHGSPFTGDSTNHVSIWRMPA